MSEGIPIYLAVGFNWIGAKLAKVRAGYACFCLCKLRVLHSAGGNTNAGRIIPLYVH